jgi:hypothetical protein
MRGMTDATTEAPHVNGQAPPRPALDAPAAEPCEDCASNGEKILAVLAIAFAAFIVVMAVDMFTGGKVTGMMRERGAL